MSAAHKAWRRRHAARIPAPPRPRAHWLRAFGMGALAGVLILALVHVAGHLI